MERLSYSLGVLLALGLLHSLTVPPVDAQMHWPLQGQGLPPPGVTAVNVDVVLDNLQAVHSDLNSWCAMHWVHLSWVDPRAEEAIKAGTEAWIRKAAASDNSYNAFASCMMYCDSSKHPTAGCCDQLWLPQVEGNNLVSLSEDASYRWRIWMDPATPSNTNTLDGTNALAAAGITTNSTAPTNSTNPTSTPRMVHWVTRITAEWQSAFDFRAYPFEHQHLLMELSVATAIADRVYLKVGKFGLVSNMPHNKGDNVPGWHVSKMTRHVFDSTGCFNSTRTEALYQVSEDKVNATVTLKPFSPGSWAGIRNNMTRVGDGTIITKNIYECPQSGSFSPEETAQYGPQIIVLDITVSRTQLYYILTNIVPLLLLDYMVFIVYAMEGSDLESRMGVVVTLVLSVSALQFTFDFPPDSYLNTVQQITLMTYCLYFIVAVQSMLTSYMCRLHCRRREYEQLKSASRSHQERGVTGRAATVSQIFKRITSVLGRFKHTEKANGSYATPPTPGRGGSSGHNPAAATNSQINALSNTFMHGGPGSATNGAHLSLTMSRTHPPGGPVAEALETDRETDREMSYSQQGSEAGTKKRKSGFGCGKPFSCFKKRPARSEVSIRAQQSVTGAKPLKKTKTIKRMGLSIVGAARKTRHIQKRIDADEAYATMVAKRMDQIFAWFLLVSFTVIVAVLLYVNHEVGNHNMTLAAAGSSDHF